MIRVGVVGLSPKTTPVLLNPMRKLREHIKVVGVAPNVGQKRTEEMGKYAKENDIERVFDDVSELLKDPTINTVFVPTNASTKVEEIGRALSAGKHVISESPTALNRNDAAKLVEEAKQQDRLLIETHHFLHHPFLKHVFRNIVNTNVIGSPLGIKINLKHGFNVAALKSRGATLECGPHTIALINRIASSLFRIPAISSAFHSVGTLAKDLERQSVFHCLLMSDFKEEPVPLLVKQSVISNDPCSTLHIVGTQAEVLVNNWWDVNEDTEVLIRRKKEDDETNKIVVQRLQNPFPDRETAFEHQLGHIISAIRSGSYGEPLDHSPQNVIANAELLQYANELMEDPQAYRLRTAFHDKLPQHMRGFMPSDSAFYTNFVNAFERVEDDSVKVGSPTYDSVPPRSLLSSDVLRSLNLLDSAFFHQSGISIEEFFSPDRNPAHNLGDF